VRAAHVAERPQVGDLGLELLPLGSGERLSGAGDRARGLARARVRLIQDHAGAHLRLAQDVVVALTGLHGDLPAVGLRVGHVAVGGLLGLRQHVHRLHVTVFRPDPGVSAVSFEHPVAQPQHLLVQHGVLAEHPGKVIGDPLTEIADLRLIKTAPAQAGRRESRRPHEIRRHRLTVHAGHHVLQP
jgi:hypothetical protein